MLKAISSPLRLQVLNLLFDKGQLSYSELMNSLKMNPSRDAGRFAYHLKFLLKADLIEGDVETRKYFLTELGKMVIDVADRVEKKAFKQKGMLVRTSRFALEEFDVNRIANSLMKEARMSAELAQKVAKETEKRLLKSRTKYLTAPLVREIVNGVLVEKGLEEYRHKLTRLGLPVHEVTALVEAGSRASRGSASVQKLAGEKVLEEYTLLNMFPRDVADAHVSGSIHINDLGSWTLKPSEVMHDLRFFFQNGLNLEKINPLQLFCAPPESLDAALSMTFSVLLHTSKEVDETQTVDYFNVFLAPFIKGADPLKVKEALRLFIINISQHVTTSLGLELTVPEFLAKKHVRKLRGEKAESYADLVEESQLLASLILDIFIEEGAHKPLFNPRIILKIRPETFTDSKAKELLLKAHVLAAKKGVPYFAILSEKGRKHSVFSASGCKLGSDFSGDWEIDTLRTGCIGRVAINLPRISCECEGDKTRFFELLNERLEIATRALEIKNRALKQHGKGLIPFLTQNVGNDQYFRLENCSSTLDLTGLQEAAETFCQKKTYDEEAGRFAEEIIQAAFAFADKVSRRRGKRLLLAALPDFEAAERLAQLDIERYGIAKVRFSGARDKPFYSTISKLIVNNDEPVAASLLINKKIGGSRMGGNLAVVEFGEAERKPDELLQMTERIVEKDNIDFFTYNFKLTYCTNCRESWFGLQHKCPSCGAIGTLTSFNRFPFV